MLVNMEYNTRILSLQPAVYTPCWLFHNLVQHKSFPLQSQPILEILCLEWKESEISRSYQIWGGFAETAQTGLV